jgi:hypothetical protein
MSQRRASAVTPATRTSLAAAPPRRSSPGSGDRRFRLRWRPDWSSKPPITSAEQRIAHRRGRRGEPDEALIARAAEARRRPRPSDELDAACQRLLAAAIRQLQLTTEQLARMLALAQSVAQLADQPHIHPAHLAEAIQYRPRIPRMVELLEPGQL